MWITKHPGKDTNSHRNTILDTCMRCPVTGSIIRRTIWRNPQKERRESLGNTLEFKIQTWSFKTSKVGEISERKRAVHWTTNKGEGGKSPKVVGVETAQSILSVGIHLPCEIFIHFVL